MARPSALAVLMAALALLAAAPAALADTCCGSATVTFDPPRAIVGQTVRLDGLVCVDASIGSPIALASLERFWLTTAPHDAFLDGTSRPDVGDWPTFASATAPGTTLGTATIVIPDLPDGRYELWWACAEDSGTGGISHVVHFSTGDRLVIGTPPTDTAARPGSAVPAARTTELGLLVLVGSLAGAAMLLRLGRRRVD